MEPMPNPILLRQRLRESLKVALQSRDSAGAAAFRSALSSLDNAEAADRSLAPPPTGGVGGDVRLGVGAGEVVRRTLSAQEVLEVIRAEIRDRLTAAAEYEELGRAEQASSLKAGATALESFLEGPLEEF